MSVYESMNAGMCVRQPSGRLLFRWLIVFLAGTAISGALALAPRVLAADVVVVDVVAVAEGYRASKLQGVKVVNSQNEKIGELDDLIVGKDRVLFAIIQVGGFLGIGSYFVAVPYNSLQISDNGARITLPGATKEQVKRMPEFKYK
jgi:sporulation protein YlmC with PRC-barrel domain